jgi:Na+-driven multidrug efflux pump
MFYAMSAIIGPFVGQNLSARRTDRIFEALKLCSLFSMAFGLLVAVLLGVFGAELSGLFSDHEEVVRTSTLFLWIAPISYGAYGTVMVMNASFNGMGRPMPAVAISIARMAVIYIPLAYLAEKWFDITGIFVAYAIANLLSGVLAYVWAIREVKQQVSDDELAEPVVISET